MPELNEKLIPPPVNPITVKLNLFVLKLVFSSFMAKWLPGFNAVVTSDYRTQEQNEAAGGAANSAHLHGLALDFKLQDKGTGAMIGETQAKALYDQFVVPNWHGFTEWEGSSKGEGYHIHVNLSREVTTYAGLVSAAGLGVIGIAMLSGWGKGKA